MAPFSPPSANQHVGGLALMVNDGRMVVFYTTYDLDFYGGQMAVLYTTYDN